MSAADELDGLLARYPALASCRDQIAEALEVLSASFAGGGKLLLCGNGGSAADCEHIAGELLKGFERARPLPADAQRALAAQGPEGEALARTLQGALPAISLVGHISLSSAFANDVAPEMVFAQMVSALGRPGDALLAISTSGKARNVVHAARTARALGLRVIGLSGQGGGTLAEMCDACIIAPGQGTAAVQELHVPIYHFLCRALEARFFGD